MDRFFCTRAAMGENEAITEFNVGLGPACGSILNTSSDNKFWCADTSKRKKISTMILTMAGFLKLIPKGVERESPNSPSGKTAISQVHLKVDAEGADLAVLRGAGEYLHILDTVVIECKADNNEQNFREGECVAKDALKFMEEKELHLIQSG